MARFEYDPSFAKVYQRMMSRLDAPSQEDALAAKAGSYVPLANSGTLKIGSHKGTYSSKDPNLSVVFTTLPQCGSMTEVLDGQTEMVLHRPQMKKAILDTPGFPQFVPVPPSPESYSIVEIPSKGLGMVATRDIPFGELIVAERAMLIAVRGAAVSAGTKERMYRDSLNGVEKYLECAIERMESNPKCKKNAESYKKLCNSHLHDGSGPLTGILRTNAFAVPLPLDTKGENSHSAVFDKLSRINHSCSPNTYRSWNTASLSLQIYAVRDIKKGEELTTWYTSPLDPLSERKSDLAKYGINCRCRACTNPASERHRVQISSAEDRCSVDLIVSWASERTLPDNLLLKPVLDMIKLIEKEGVEACDVYSTMLHRLSLIYFALGRADRAKQYHQRWRRWQQIYSEEPDSDAILQACMDIFDVSKVVGARL